MRRFAVIATALGLLMPFGAQAHAQTDPADFVVTGHFDKAAYDFGDDVTTTLTITNSSDQTATGLVGQDYGDIDYSDEAWGAFRPDGPGATLHPGESVVLVLTAEVSPPWDEAIDLTLVVSGDTVGFSSVELSAPFARSLNDLSGTVYFDHDENGVIDQYEGQAGVHVTAEQSWTGNKLVTSTDQEGRFRFGDVPAGEYSLSFDNTDTLIAPFLTATVTAGGENDVTAELTRPRSETLRASVRFTANTYAAGDRAELVVRLFNSGTRPATGITALCTGSGTPNELIADPIGWGALAEGGAGVTIPAGTTRTYRVWNTVPDAARQWGVFVANCLFDSTFDRGSPLAQDHAKVPGATQTTNIRLYEDRNDNNVIDAGEGVRAKVTLVDRFTGRAVATGRSKANGVLAIPDVPTGAYILRIAAPWQFSWQAVEYYTLVEGNDYRATFEVIPLPA
jgi:hypothetical protein